MDTTVIRRTILFTLGTILIIAVLIGMNVTSPGWILLFLGIESLAAFGIYRIAVATPATEATDQ